MGTIFCLNVYVQTGDRIASEIKKYIKTLSKKLLVLVPASVQLCVEVVGCQRQAMLANPPDFEPNPGTKFQNLILL